MSTLSEVARRAGVSLATASRALNGSPGRTVRPELRERVERAALELNYQPHAAAQTMARGHANSVGLIVNDISDPYFSGIALGVSTAASEFGCIVTLSSTGVTSGAKAAVVDLIAGQRARALILAGAVPPDDADLSLLRSALRRLMATGTRVCSIGGEALRVDTVELPNKSGATALAGALLGLGHRSFVILGGPAEHPSTKTRADAFTERVQAAGGRVTRRIHTGLDRAAGYAAMDQALGHPLPDAVFATNDLLALGALRRLREAGVRVPQDIGLAGFGDSEVLADVQPQLTSVFMDARRAGELAARLVLGDPDQPPDLRLGFEVRLRESTLRESAEREPNLRPAGGAPEPTRR